ncbi:hypothetical protein Cni_G19511 [Canna indica]|uniref:Fungal lipase-like domain-containing protein n=1 Tax=Canna indica TaxID=4628 RepID=A0AAQ3KKP7_9LILI|nr:hypothetical protein Cni_G19511 [Canna indica]
MRPTGGPRVVLALSGTLTRFCQVSWSSRTLNKMVERFGSKNVCVGGHSLGSGFALQVGKALAKQDP